MSQLHELEDRSVPATLTWVGDRSGGWIDTFSGGAGLDTNWSGDVLPQDGDTLIFPAGAGNQDNFNNNTAVLTFNIEIQGGDYDISGNTFNLGAGGLTVTGGEADLTMTLGGTGGVAVNAGTLRFTDPPSVPLVTNPNTYTGGTVVNGGTLALNRPGAVSAPGGLTIGDGTGTAATVTLLALGQIADAAAVVVNGDGTLSLNSQADTVGTLTTNDGGLVVGPGTLTVNGNVVLNGGTGNDAYAVTSSTGATASVGVRGSAAFTLTIGGSVGSFTVNGNDGDDTLTITTPVSTSFFNPPGGLIYKGGLQSAGGSGDSLVISGGTFATVTYTFTGTNAEGHQGTIDLGTGAPVISFQGLEPISNTGTATDVVFVLPDVANEAVLEPAGGGQTRLRSPSNTFEDTTFATPTGSITVTGGTQNDVISYAGVSGPNAPTVTLNGAGGDDTFNLSSDGAALTGNLDAITATVTVAGGAGSNLLKISDYSSAAANTSVSLFGGAVRRLAGPTNTVGIDYTGISGLTVIGSNTAADTVSLFELTLPLFLSTGGGADVVTVFENDAPVTVDGGAGNDQLIIADPFSSETNGVTAPLTFLGGLGDDLFTIRNADGLGAPVSVDGGGQATAAGDSLVIGDGQFSLVTYTFTTTDPNGHNGTISFDGIPLAFSGLEPITNAGTATNVVFNLPDVANTAVLEPAGGGLSRLRSVFNTFEDTSFATPTGSLTVNGSNSPDTIIFNGLVNPLGPTRPTVVLTGGGGIDTFDIDTGGGPGGAAGVTVDGGDGADQVRGFGGASDDAVTFTLSKAGGRLDGVGPGVAFSNVEGVTADGRAGTNNVTWQDATGTAYGTADNPDAGVFVRPTGPGEGSVTLAGAPALTFTAMAGGLTLFGTTQQSSPGPSPSAVSSGDRDAVTVLGVSTTGLASPFGEMTSSDGTDTVSMSDQGVTIRNAALGALVPVTLGELGGETTFSALYVRTGNELEPTGDAVTATPSNRLFLYADGGDPRLGTPADTIVPSGTAALVLVSGGGTPVYQYAAAGGAVVTFVRFEVVPQAPTPGIFIGTDAGAVVCVFNADGTLDHGVAGPGFEASRVAGADFNRDGVLDVAVASGVGTAPRVAIIDGESQQAVAIYTPFEPGFTGGLYVAAGDVDGDGIPDMAVAAGSSGGPRVQVFLSRGSQSLTLAANFFGIDDPGFRGGTRIALGDLNRDGYADLVVVAGPGGGPRVATYDGRALAGGVVSRLWDDFFAFDADTRTGAFVAIGDVNGDGFGDYLFGAEDGGGPRVTVYSGLPFATTGTGAMGGSFFVFPENVRGGVRVAARDLNGNGTADLIVGAGAGNGNRVKVFPGETLFTGGTAPVQDFDSIPGLKGGVYVG